MRTLSLLIVDDDLRMRQLMRDILAGEGLAIQLCKNGLEAAHVLTARKIDILLTDLVLPHLDGLEVLDVARSANPDGKVILVTGYASVDSAVEAFKKGAFDYIEKPFEPDDLLTVVRRAAEQIGQAAEVAISGPDWDDLAYPLYQPKYRA